MPALKFLIVSIPTILAAYLTIILVFFSDDKDTTSEVILDSLTNKVTGRLSLGNDSLIKLHELSLSEIHSIDDKVDSLSAIESRNKLLKSKEKYFLDIKGDKDGISMLSRYLKESSVTFTNSQKYTIWVDASPSSGFLKLSLRSGPHPLDTFS